MGMDFLSGMMVHGSVTVLKTTELHVLNEGIVGCELSLGKGITENKEKSASLPPVPCLPLSFSVHSIG